MTTPPNRRQALAALTLPVPMALAACATPGRPSPATATPLQIRPTMTLDQTRQAALGRWTSIAPELRPSAQKNPDGSARPFYLRRDFQALPQDRFTLEIVNYADAAARVPLARLLIRGHMAWRGDHPIAPGAQKVDFTADEGYDVTPLLPAFAEVLNKVAAQGYAPWAVGQTQSILGKDFAPFGLVAGRHFMEYDLVYLAHGLMFWGARHVDGRGFDTEANRPTLLQIPLAPHTQA